MSAYLDRECRTYRQALAARMRQAIKRGTRDHEVERELARINMRQATKHLNPNNKIALAL